MESIYEEEEVEQFVDLSKKYQFSKDVVIRKYEDSNLVIYTKGVLWLVFSDAELEVYEALSNGKSIEETLEIFEEDIVISVISQIEAKRFEKPIVKEIEEKNIYIYLTNNCNQRCHHCYMYAGDIKIQEMSPEIWKKILYVFKENGGHGVTFTGGEVTVYKGFDNLLSYAHELGLSVTVLSNGILWQNNDIIRCAPYIDEIQISIDGYDKESYFDVRQYDGFDKAISSLLRFNEEGVRTSMAVTPLYDDLDEFIEKFEPFAARFIKDYPDIYIRFNLELLDGRDVSKTQIDNTEYRKKLAGLVERLYPEYYIDSFPLSYENHVIRKNCGFGEISIAANGDVYWCNRIHELESVLNVNKDSFEDILMQSEYIKKITDVNNSSACKNCEVKYICGGDCRMNYPDIQNAENHEGVWEITCPLGTKESIYRNMILSNEFFYVDVSEE